MTRLKILMLLLTSALVLSGCGGFDVYKLPLPGGPDAGSNPMTIKVEFPDVLDLVPRSTVKVNDVSVGQVSDVALKGSHAVVTLEMRNDIKVPVDAVAEIRQTSLLGEKFVSLSAPPGDQSTSLLRSGDVIPLSRAGRNPEVEEVLGALSLLLNGGGVAQLKTINVELGKALQGRESSARSVLEQIRVLVTQLDDNKTDIVNAIDSLNRLALSVRKQQGSIDLALEELPSALRSINSQRDDLIKMLRALDRLSGVGVRVIKASKASTIDTFRQLQPVLTGLANSGDNFTKAFSVFLTYPFVDEVVGRDPQVARNLHMGDYTNLSIEVDLSVPNPLPSGLPTDACITLAQLPNLGQLPDPSKLCADAAALVQKCLKNPSLTQCAKILDLIKNQVCSATPNNPICNVAPPPSQVVNDIDKCLNSNNPASKACRSLDKNQLRRLADECKKKKNKDNLVCKALVVSGGGNGPITLPTKLPGVGGAATLPRPGFGAPRPQAWSSTHGPTMGQLMQLYDPSLVNLLVPGMVVSR
jgi:phospholipid/cholesterol/gamma-HCH transport system substrate-binding protein